MPLGRALLSFILMAKHLTHAQFTRQIIQPYLEQQSRNHRAIVEFEKLGRQPKVWPSKLIPNPLDQHLIKLATGQASQCGCMKLSCRLCGFVAFHARVRSVERPYCGAPQ